MCDRLRAVRYTATKFKCTLREKTVPWAWFHCIISLCFWISLNRDWLMRWNRYNVKTSLEWLYEPLLNEVFVWFLFYSVPNRNRWNFKCKHWFEFSMQTNNFAKMDDNDNIIDVSSGKWLQSDNVSITLQILNHFFEVSWTQVFMLKWEEFRFLYYDNNYYY